MPKPLNENLRHVHIETDDGSLMPVMDAAGERLAELINAISAHRKAGKLRLMLDIKPHASGTLTIKADIVINKPKGAAPEALLWPTPEGNLIGEDPRQNKLELKAVEQPARELKNMTA